jgi:hypothetical protein
MGSSIMGEMGEKGNLDPITIPAVNPGTLRAPIAVKGALFMLRLIKFQIGRILANGRFFISPKAGR